jgi:hypothetical protein
VAIQQVQAMYGHAVDWSDQSLLPKVFTKDAIFDGRKAGPDSYYEGLPAISAWFGQGKPPHPKVHNIMKCIRLRRRRAGAREGEMADKSSQGRGHLPRGL